jgi:two-component system, NarL family, sensor kinase
VPRLLTNPVVQFLAAGFVVLVLVVLGTVRLSQSAADHEAIVDARKTTALLGRSVAQPAIPRGLVDGDPGAVNRFDKTALRRLLVDDVKRIKIWRRDGRIVYSDKVELIGNRFPLGEDEVDVLEHGRTDAEISDLSAPENRFERGGGDLLEVYTRMRSPEGEPLLFEAYYSAADIAKRRKQVYDSFQPIALGGLLVLVVGTTPLLWGLTRRLDRTRRDRERLLEAAADASETERRRIARDLHDGVVQDLAGTSFALSATLRDPATSPETAQRLGPMSQSLRSSLRSLRSLLVEIYPPDLGVDGLRAALEDLVAPAAGVGTTATVEVYDVEGASDESVRLVWRVAQEAVRNAIRHADAEHLTVQVRTVGSWLHLDVTDDGTGFASGETDRTGHAGPGGGIGLRSLRDLIREAGGRLDVRTSDGDGTTVHLEVRR